VTGRAGHRRSQGQSTVELALLLPVVALLGLTLLQVAVVGRDQVVVLHAAREAARSVALTADDAGALEAAAGSGLDPDRLAIEVDGELEPGRRCTVRLRYRSPTAVPVVGALVADVRFVANVTVRVE
jgi:hypothetical protein